MNKNYIHNIKKKKDNDPSNFFLYYSSTYINNPSVTKNPLEIKIHLYCLELRQKIKEGQSVSQIINLDENFFEMVNHSLNKLIRNQDDILLIEYYLMTFPNLMKAIYQKKMLYDPTDLLNKISLYIKYEEIKENTVICKLGEIGDKFYIIFFGSVAILIPREIKINLNYNEYISHLKRLYKLEEYEIVKRTINSNIHIFMTREIIEMREKLNTDLSLYYSSNVQEIISIREYINRLEPIILDNNLIEEISLFKNKHDEEINEDIKHSVTCWSYYYVTNITQGQTFGDIALSDDIKTRTATIISLETSYLGSLNIEIYKSCIKDVQEKIRKTNIQFLLSIDIFNNIKFEIFDNKYFNFFKNIILKRGEYLFKKNMERVDIFFIKEGEIEINFEANFNDINYIIKKKENIEEDKEKKKEKIKEEKSLKKMSKFFLENKNNIKLFIYSERQICGLNDFLLDENKFFCNGKCISEKCEIFAIEYKFLYDNFLDEKQKNVLKLLIEKKEKLIIEKLKKIKGFFFRKIKEKNKNKKFFYHQVNFIKSIGKKFNLNKNNLLKRNNSFDISKNFDKKYNIYLYNLKQNKTINQFEKKINLFNNAKKIFINKENEKRKSIFSLYINGIKNYKIKEKNNLSDNYKLHLNTETKSKNKITEIIENSIEKNKLLKNNSFYKNKKNISIINLLALDDVVEKKYPNLYMKRNKSESNIKKQFTIIKKNNKKLLKIIPCPFPKYNKTINNNIKKIKTNNKKIIEY